MDTPPSEKKNTCNFNRHPKGGNMCTKFQLSQFFFSIFIKCKQLLSFISCWQLVNYCFIGLNAYISPNISLCAEFQLDWFIGGQARECNRPPDRQPSGNRAIQEGFLNGSNNNNIFYELFLILTSYEYTAKLSCNFAKKSY